MREPIAIVGMAAVFPGAPDLASYWRNIETGVDAITDAPDDRLDPALRDGLPCTRGGFIAPMFDPIAFGLMPIAAARAEPDQLLALHVAAAAIADATAPITRDRCAVILGRGGYLTPGMARLANRVRTTAQVMTTLDEVLPELDRDTRERIRAALAARAGDTGADGGGAIGLVPNLAASRVANRLDLTGPAYTIDAACASSLVAIEHACRELAERRSDAAVAGGVHVCHDITLWSVFAELGALSKRAQIRPFDRRADGIVIGEGCGVVVLKRLADAERAGDRVYAVIRGAGIASDGRESSAMRPRPDGQVAAISAAWREAERDPRAAGLVEAHGTATPTGDAVELAAIARVFGDASADGRAGRERAVLGSVKSMIGHAMPAAGAAGVIKTALALYHGVLPPSLHCDEPHPELASSRFRVAGAAEPWPAASTAAARTAGVSAFGFGGINAHVVLESHGDAVPRRRGARGRGALPAAIATPSVLAIAGDSIAELRAQLAAAASGAGADGGARADAAPPTARDGAMRLAMFDPTPERRAIAARVLDRGKPVRGHHDIWFAPRALADDGGQLAFVFPGVEAAFAVHADAHAAAVPDVAAALVSPSLEARGRGVFALGRALAAAIRELGVEPSAIAGHSLGEWTGMVVSEMIPPAEIDGFLAALPATIDVPDVVFAAIGCSADGARGALDGLADIAVSHDNCPHQSIVCGRIDSVRAAIARLNARGVLCQELPFRSGFHSPLFADYVGVHRARIATLALARPRVPLWSATLAAPYPDDADAIRRLAVAHLVEPVRFRELIDALYARGVRAFVQLGVGSVVGFVGDTLRGKDHVAIAAAGPVARQWERAVLALWVDGFVGARRTEHASVRGSPLVLGVPLLRIRGDVPPIEIGSRAAAEIDRGRDLPGHDPIAREWRAVLDEVATASRDIASAWSRRAAEPPAEAPTLARVAGRPITSAPPTADHRLQLSVAAEPALLDHCFYRQPAGWPTVSDRYPVVPMTMTIALMLDAARRARPGLVAIAVEDIRAFRWIAVAPPLDVELKVAGRGDRVDVDVPGYARATVVLATSYPSPPPPALAPLVNARPASMSARAMYDGRWMFHGPQYQGIAGLGPVGDDGVDGVIETLPAPGALLDCAGQLMGWWVMQTETRDRLAMPVRIARIALYGDHPGAGERVHCGVRIRHVGEREVRADLELTRGDDAQLWARIDGWEDRRFDSDDAVWAVLMYPENNALAESHDDYVIVREHWRSAASRELMMRRYLGERERAQHDGLGPRSRRGWLLGRIAVKDAVRMKRWDAGAGAGAASRIGAIFPVEIEVANQPSGEPFVVGGREHISVAHKDDVAVAIVGDRPVGIDIERIESRTGAFASVAFTADELALGDDGGAQRDEWMTRVWAAKEAVGKARGTGVTDPKLIRVRARDGHKLMIDDQVVDTRREGGYIIAWVRT